jgi:hypothetical protein
MSDWGASHPPVVVSSSLKGIYETYAGFPHESLFYLGYQAALALLQQDPSFSQMMDAQMR